MVGAEKFAVWFFLFCLVAGVFLVSPVYGESSEDVNVTLDAPASDSIVADFAQSFNFTPSILGNDIFYNASLIINGSAVASNQSIIQNNVLNTIYYNFSSNGVYVWNVEVWNSTTGVLASGNFTLNMAVPFPVNVSVVSPANATYSGETIIVNLSATTNGTGLLVWYSLYNSSELVVGNTTYSGLTYIGLLSSGDYQLEVYVNNTEGFSDSKVVYFAVALASEDAENSIGIAVAFGVIAIALAVTMPIVMKRRKDDE